GIETVTGARCRAGWRCEAGAFRGRPVARSSLRRPDDAERPTIRFIRGSDVGLGNWREHYRLHSNQHADSESATGPGFLRSGCAWRNQSGAYREIELAPACLVRRSEGV